jgi:hypothetical protein
MKSIVRSGLAALAIGWFIGAGCPAKAEQLVWVRAQPVDHFRAVKLVPPGSYSHNENQRPAAIAVNKAGQDVGEQMQAAKKSTQHVRLTNNEMLKSKPMVGNSRHGYGYHQS